MEVRSSAGGPRGHAYTPLPQRTESSEAEGEEERVEGGREGRGEAAPSQAEAGVPPHEGRCAWAWPSHGGGACNGPGTRGSGPHHRVPPCPHPSPPLRRGGGEGGLQEDGAGHRRA